MKHAREIIIGIVVFAVTLASAADEQRPLTYKQEVTLRGTMLKEYHREWLDMLPDSAEGRKRAKWPAYILRLDASISVRAANSEDSAFLESETNVREIFLCLLPEGAEKRMDSLVHKHVTIRGKLDHANTVHHRRPVMIDVSTIE